MATTAQQSDDSRKRVLSAFVVGVVIVVALVWAWVSARRYETRSLRIAADASMTTSSVPASTPTGPSGPPPPSDARAMRACQTRLAQYAGRDNPMHISLVAAYAATAADLSADDERKNGPGFRSRWRDRAANELEAVCFFDADAFAPLMSRSQHARTSGRAYDRLEEVVRPDGTPVVYAAGHKTTINPAPVSAVAK